jgi:hypothetical protein
VSAHAFVVGTPISLRWLPWSAEKMLVMQLTHFEFQVDGVAVSDVPLPHPVPAEFYECPLPKSLLTIGPHTVRWRACRGDVASAWTDLSMDITPIAPGMLRDVEVAAGSKPLAIDVGVEMARAYGVLADWRPLVDSDLIYLSQRFIEEHPDGILTRGRLLKLCDAEYKRFA